MSTTDSASAVTSSSLAEMIVKTPGTCAGRARIAGTRIKVEHVYNWVERQRLSPADVVREHPHLTMAQVHAALAYYWSHQEEILRDIDEGERLVAEVKAISGPSRIGQISEELDAKDNPLPPG